MKKIMLLGASGSIGSQTLDVVKHHSSEFEIIGLSVGYNMKKLAEILDALPKCVKSAWRRKRIWRICRNAIPAIPSALAMPD